MCLEVEDKLLEVFSGSGEVGFLVVAAGFVMKGGDDDVVVDGLAAAGPILQNALCLGKIDKCFLREVLVDETLGLEVVCDEFLHVLI